MTDYCSNSVTFTGKNTDMVLTYFQHLNESSLFSEISVQKDTLNFRSQRIPSITELNLIAEQFDVSYNLEYRLPYENAESYEYICLQHEALEPSAEQVREFINRAQTKTQLKGTERLVDDFLLNRTFGLRELGLFSCLLKRRFAELERKNEVGQNPWESNDQPMDRKRGR